MARPRKDKEARLVRVAITITPWQVQWLRKHQSINLSGLVRDTINKLIQDEK